MRTERVVYVHNRHQRPLSLHARFAWSFFGVGIFVAISLSLLGLYILKEAIRNPLQSSSDSVVGAGFMLTFSLFLLLYMIWPRVKALFEEAGEAEEAEMAVPAKVLMVYEETLDLHDASAEGDVVLPSVDREKKRNSPLTRALAPTNTAPRTESGGAARGRR